MPRKPSPGETLASRNRLLAGLPIPTRVLTNGEFDPPPATKEQRRVRHLLEGMGERLANGRGLTRRQFFRTASGLAAGFLAMNAVYGPLFAVSEAEAADDEAAEERRTAHAGQFILDDQLHFVHPGYTRTGVLDIRRRSGRDNNPDIFRGPGGDRVTHADIQFLNFVDEVYLQSQTTVGLLSGAPADEPEHWFLPNWMKRQAKDAVNGLSGSTRLLFQAVFAPGHPGWLEAMDQAIEELRPDSWKGYTVGDPQTHSRYPFRLDDEQLVYPAYEKMVKSGVRTVCIHKGLLPSNYLESYENWRHATVEDLPKAAKDWPQLNFVIYHSAIRPGYPGPEYLREVERTGRVPWVTDLAEIPARHGVTNVMADLGTVFAASAVQHPRLAALILGTLIKGLGEDKVFWGTDSVWHGSPQWQIEAFRRIEIPEDMRERFGYQPLGGPRGKTRDKILGLNAARLYGLDPRQLVREAAADRMSAMRREVESSGYEADGQGLLLAAMSEGIG